MISRLCDKLSEIPETASFQDLRPHFQTGRSVRLPSEWRGKKYGYRTGVMTDIGDIEISVWRDAALRLIQNSGEMPIYNALVTWVSQHTPWLRTKQEFEIEALELHIRRIFEAPDWAGHNSFWCLFSVQTS